MQTQKQINEYDMTKGMLNTIRKFQHHTKSLREQVEPGQVATPPANNTSTENTDFTIINNVEVVVNSTDEQDLIVNDEEKGKISQLIDDFRSEVSEIADLGKLNLYEDSGKLDGKITNFNLNFLLSSGDDNGVYINAVSMLKITDEVMDMITKLKAFESKFSVVVNDIISARKQN